MAKKTRCPECAKHGRDTRGDNLTVYADGHSHCFSCGYHTDAEVSTKNKKKKFKGYPYGTINCHGIEWIDISEETCLYAGIKEQPLLDYDYEDEDAPSGLVYFPFIDLRTQKLIGYKSRDFYAEFEEGLDKNECIKTRGEQTIGGLQTLDLKKRELVIWEGETDWLHAIQCDKRRNHLYFPGNQTSKYLKDIGQLLRKFRRIYIAPDADEAGDILLEECTELLPKFKTFVIDYRQLGVNDLKEAILESDYANPYRSLITSSYAIGEPELITGDELRTAIKSYFHDTSQIDVVSTGYNCIDSMLGNGLVPGVVVGLTANEGIGKSTLAANIAYNIIESGVKCAWIGTEMQFQQVMVKFMERDLATHIYKDKETNNWSISDEEIDESMTRLSQNIVFYNGQRESWDSIYENLMSAIYSYDVRVLFIDVLGDLPGMTDWKESTVILQDMNSIACGDSDDNRPPISIVTVLHQKDKDGKSYDKPTLDKVQGGMAIRQKHTAIIAMSGVIGEETIRFLKLVKAPRNEIAHQFYGLLEFNRDERFYYEPEETENEEQLREKYSSSVKREYANVPVRKGSDTIQSKVQARFSRERRGTNRGERRLKGV